MMSRDPVSVAPPALVVHPQRASTAVVLTVIGAVGLAGVLGSAAWTAASEGLNRGLVGGLVVGALFTSIFLVIGLRGWMRRVVLTLPDDRTLALRWTEWPSGTRTSSVLLADVVDVALDHDEGMARIVIMTTGEPIPLTRSLTSDDLTGKVAAIRAFLGPRRG